MSENRVAEQQRKNVFIKRSKDLNDFRLNQVECCVCLKMPS